jgi:ectoine hydroxylase-related dioxygenase (phytanoyl-CoA dioxygenase family)
MPAHILSIPPKRRLCLTGAFAAPPHPCFRDARPFRNAPGRRILIPAKTACETQLQSDKRSGEMAADLKEQWAKEGYVVVRGAFDARFNERVRAISEDILGQWRANDPDTGKKAVIGDMPVMRHLNRPEYFKAGSRQAFSDFMDAIAHENILSVARMLLGENMLFRCASLFFNPDQGNLDGNWHRDTQFITKSEAADRALVENNDPRQMGAQIQVALAPSEDIEVVPGSHLRWDTPEEYAVRLADGKKNCRSNAMPGALRVSLQAGDAVMFNPVAHHRGRYHADKLRRSLMLTYTTRESANFDYFTNQKWFLDENYLAGLKTATRAFFQPFISAFKDKWLAEKQSAASAY